MTDLLALTAELVDIPSVSHHERRLADHLEQRLRAVPWLTVDRVGDEVVARTARGARHRLILAGHTDTVPPNGNERARMEGDSVHGLGAADMKSGLAVFLALATGVADPAIDVTYVFYTAEEVESRHNGLGRLVRERPDLVAGDAAVLGEPTGGAVEAGCQGSMRLVLTLAGRRAHAARPWKGRNAVHRLGPVLRALEGYEPRRPVLDDCEFREALQAVGVEGGVAGNVVPDRAALTLNHRFAPDRDAAEAEVHVRRLLQPVLDPDDVLEVIDVAAGAAPGLDHPLLRALVDAGPAPVRAKLGWTDVARFAGRNIPATNFGPGDPAVAHSAGERVSRSDLEIVYRVLRALLEAG